MIRKALTISIIRWCAMVAFAVSGCILVAENLSRSQAQELSESGQVTREARLYSRTEGVAVLVNPGRDLAAHGITGKQVGQLLVQKLTEEESRTKAKAFVYSEVMGENTSVLFLVHSHHPGNYDREAFPEMYTPSEALKAVPEIAGLFMRHLDLQEQYRAEAQAASECDS